MNYRHQYHAGNYADVFKHVLLLLLVRGMQRKERGFLYLDTHAGRGGYDLTQATVLPDGRERAPEWPAGVGRLWEREDLPAALQAYLDAVRAFNLRGGGTGATPQFYPGSPWIARAALRGQDRAVLCELREDDAEALAGDFRADKQVSVRAMNGYTALKALLPPVEKRALVLIDPPFESAGEFADILEGLTEGLRRLPGGTFAIWYPITERARSERFLGDLATLPENPPALCVEMQIAADSAQVRMKGCGLVVLNPPWQIEQEIARLLPTLVEHLRIDAGGATRLFWPVPER